MEKRYDHSACDAAIQTLWQKSKTYQQTIEGFKQYTIDTPPPTVSGTLHIGHIFSYTQTDIIARYKRMTGHNVFYPFGFDCNGLPTERFVEKKHKTNAAKIGREKFIDRCLATTEEIKKNFVALWQQIGLSANFDQTYSTISKDVQKISQESFVRLFNNNFAYIKNEPALYCTKSRTTVAQAELEDVEQATTFNSINFTSQDGQKLTIATTRPELLPSCVALLYHPNDSRYTSLKNQKALVPIFGHQVPILEDDLVEIDKGTGLVMVCTFGDKTDIEWYKKHKLPYKQSIGLNGKFVEGTSLLEGLNVKDARKAIINELKEQGLLVDQKEIVHNVNVYERSKNEIEYIILPQWFINIVDHKEKFLQAADQISWKPKHMKSRLIDWVTNLSWDWCISRQRVYGIPFPVWYCDDCNHTIVAELKDLPLDPQQTAYDKPCPQCRSSNIRPEKDVMDTWNTSSLTPYICKQLFEQTDQSPFEGDSSFLPMTMRPQAHDIIRTWAFYTIIKSWMHNKQIPWDDIVISGYVLSENKEKISKSKNNAPTEPEQLLKLYAPDAIRFWTASGTLGQDIAFSPDQIKIGQKLMNKIWNAFKFMNMNLEGYSHTPDQPDNLGVVNQWMIDQTQQALTSYKKYFDQNEFSLALQSIEQLFWQDFCDNYIEIIKDQLLNPDKYEATDVEKTKWTLYSTSFMILQMYAPYMPHITEHLYQNIFKSYHQTSSLHLTQLPEITTIDEHNQQSMQVLLEIISQVRKLKTEQQLSLKTELKTLTISTDKNYHQMIQEQQGVIKGVCKAAQLIITDAPTTNQIATEGDTHTAFVQISI